MSKYTETKVGEYIVRKYIDGDESWWLNGELHRKDGPAVKWADRSEMWYKNGNLHREDGPAVKYADGNEIYYLNNKYYSKQEYKLISVSYRMNITV